MNTITITCPNCGRQYQIHTTHYQGVYLNGMPKLSMEDMMSMFVICQCGLLVAAREWCGVITKTVLPTASYQAALHATYASETEQKLAILNELYHFPQVEMYYAHYYDELGDIEQRNKHLGLAAQRILTEQDIQDYMIDGDEMYNMKSTYMLVLNPATRLVDLYRCMGRFGDAKKQIKKLRKDAATEEYRAYLKVESALIKSKNTTIL